MEKKTVKDLVLEDNIYTIINGDLKVGKVTKLEFRNMDSIFVQIAGAYGETCTANQEDDIINGNHYKYYINKIDAYLDYIGKIEEAIKSDSNKMVELVYRIRQNEQLLKEVKGYVEKYSIKNGLDLHGNK